LLLPDLFAGLTNNRDGKIDHEARQEKIGMFTSIVVLGIELWGCFGH
jgi:hypothetical protein